MASLYGAVNEEVLLRLFLFTFIYAIFRKTVSSPGQKRGALLWSSNLLVALIFGLGHLPAALKLSSPSAFEIGRVLLLNGIPGLVFGWLYWNLGFWTAVTAHLTADLVIHAFLIG